MENRKKKVKTSKKKTYIKDFITFVVKKLGKKTLVLMCIFFVFSILLFAPVIGEVKSDPYNGDITLMLLTKDKILILLGIVIASLVPYLYIPVLAGTAYIIQITIEFSNIIVHKGYFLGIAGLLIPFILNLFVASIMTAIGIYLCKINTNKFISGQQKNMNLDTFRLELYKAIGKKEKEMEIEEKIKIKEEKMASKEMKIDYKQLLNTCVFCIIIQFVSSLIEYIIL